MTLNTEEIKEILSSLGYNLVDKGAYWQTNAVFRQGDNKTALLIYKNSGVWRDFVNDAKPMPFRALLEAHLGTNCDSEINKYIKPSERGSHYSPSTSETAKVKIEMEETYPEEILNKLLPHYKFYNDKGISQAVLKSFKCGLATEGQMYQRFVFPIYNEHGQIHGFAGRDMVDKPNRPKWKHIGKKTKWIYPLFVREETREAINENGVILVESIGDMLNLIENGIENVLVTFGLDISPALLCALIGLSPKSITLALNNDSSSEINRGLVASSKNYLKLLKYFDRELIKICLPIKSDFGDMSSEDFVKWKVKDSKINFEQQRPHLLEIIKDFHQKKMIPKSLYKNIKNL